jgi:trigger factor
VPGADDHLRGAAKGATVEFESPFGEVEGEEQTVTIALAVKDVKEMILPEVTDEWAGEASEFETVAELEADLRQRMGMVKKVQANMAVRDEAVKALAELVEDDVPEPLVNSEMERRLHDLAHRLEAQGATIQQYLEATGQGQQQLVEDLRGAAKEAVKADLALRALAEAEQLEVTEDDLETEIAQLADRMQQPVGALRAQLEAADQMPAVRSDIRKAKALGWLMEHVEIVDEEGNTIDRADLQPDPVEASNDEAAGDTDSVEDAE